jgi:hypothetical protein
MASKPIHLTSEGNTLYGGLEWSTLPERGATREMRTYAHSKGATAAVVLSARNATESAKGKQVKRLAAGIHSGLDKVAKKGSHSLAAAFAVWTSENAEAMSALCVSVGPTTKSEDQWAVVVCDNGLPQLDGLYESKEAAREALAPYLGYKDIVLWTDDPVSYPNSETDKDLLENIGRACNRTTRLSGIPPDYLLLTTIAVVLLGILYGYSSYKKEQERKARAAEIARRAAEDPRPKYLAALALARQTARTDILGLQEARKFAMGMSLKTRGWNLEKFQCSLTERGCKLFFTRTTGTFNSLEAQMRPLGLVPASAVNIDKAVMYWEHNIGVGPIANDLPTLADFVQKTSGNKLQDWRTVGMNIETAMPSLWPRVPGVPVNFKAPEALYSSQIAVNQVHPKNLREVLDTAPEGVYWREFTIDILRTGTNKDISANAKVIGDMYVKN